MAKWVLGLFETNSEYPTSFVGVFNSKEEAFEAVSPDFKSFSFELFPIETVEELVLRLGSTYTKTFPQEHRGKHLPCHECGDPAKVWLPKESSGLICDTFWCNWCIMGSEYELLVLPIWEKAN